MQWGQCLEDQTALTGDPKKNERSICGNVGNHTYTGVEVALVGDEDININ